MLTRPATMFSFLDNDYEKTVEKLTHPSLKTEDQDGMVRGLDREAVTGRVPLLPSARVASGFLISRGPIPPWISLP